MDATTKLPGPGDLVDATFSAAERTEMRALRLLDDDGRILSLPKAKAQVPRAPIEAKDVLNEAYDYALPASFTRGLSVTVQPGQRTLYISGTSAVDDHGASIHVGDFRAQLWRTYHNITRLLEAEDATWHDIVRTSCYLRDIDRDYVEFNKVRTLFFTCLGLDPLPASTGIQAGICRSDLLIEIEAIALLAGR